MFLKTAKFVIVTIAKPIHVSEIYKYNNVASIKAFQKPRIYFK